MTTLILSVFKAASTDLDELVDTMTWSFCEDVCVCVCAKEEAYKSGDRILYRPDTHTLTNVNRVAKRSYTENLKNRFSTNDPVSLWRTISWSTT